MMGPYDTPYSGHRIVALANKLAGLNRENITDWLIEIGIDQDFADKIAKIVAGSPLEMARAILLEVFRLKAMGIKIEESRYFKYKMITMGIPSYIWSLHERATDITFRSMTARHLEVKEEEEGGF